MLVLSRKKGQSFRIGDDIVVTIIGIRENNIRIGIEAPRKLSVLRTEIESRGDNDPGAREVATDAACSGV